MRATESGIDASLAWHDVKWQCILQQAKGMQM